MYKREGILQHEVYKGVAKSVIQLNFDILKGLLFKHIFAQMHFQCMVISFQLFMFSHITIKKLLTSLKR